MLAKFLEFYHDIGRGHDRSLGSGHRLAQKADSSHCLPLIDLMENGGTRFPSDLVHLGESR